MQSLAKIQNIFPSPKMAAIFGDFRNFLPKLAKHKFASISLTLCEIENFVEIARSRTRRSKQICNFAIFGKKISKIPKNGRHFWGFSKIFAKIAKLQICLDTP